MANGRAEKYFSVFNEGHENKKPVSDNSIKKVIKEVYENVEENTNKPGSYQQPGYISPKPEKTVSGKDESLEDVVKEVKGLPKNSSKKSSSKSPGSSAYSKPVSKPILTSKANPVKYIFGEAVGAILKELVPDPQTATYVVTNALVVKVLGSPKTWSQEVINQLAAAFGTKYLEEMIRQK